jgi:hypothetical protein
LKRQYELRSPLKVDRKLKGRSMTARASGPRWSFEDAMTPNRLIALVICGAPALVGIAWHFSRPRENTTSNRAIQDDAAISDGVDRQLQTRTPVHGVSAQGNILAHLRKMALKARPNTPMDPKDALAIASLMSDADYTCTGRYLHVGGHHASDLVIKRYWSGTGAAYDLIVCLDEGRGNFWVYKFPGSERGINFYGYSYIPLESHLVDLNHDGQVQIVIPQCLIDRGASTIINWPTIYQQRGREYVVADKQFPRFYSTVLLPKIEAIKPDLYDEVSQVSVEQDKRVVAMLVRAVSEH